MFDSNGRLPFFQEGILEDVVYVDLCEGVLSYPGCELLPAELRYTRIPYGNANGPGTESGCKGAREAKYCHNYYAYYIPDIDQGSLNSILIPT